jgi:WD40 repeat protein
MRQRKTRRGIEQTAYSPSGRLLLGRDGHFDVHVWDALTLEPVEVIPAADPREKLLDCLFRPGGLLFLRVQGYVSNQQGLPDGPARPEHAAVLPGPAFRDDWVNTHYSRGNQPDHWLCFGPDGHSFVGWGPGASSGYLGLWRFGSKKCERLLPRVAEWAIRDIAFEPRGRFLAAGMFNHEMGLVDFQPVAAVYGALPHSDEVVRVAWSPTAPLVAASATRSVWLWDAPAVMAEAARSTGPWDPPKAAPLHRFTGFRKTVEALAFSPDGTSLVAASREGRARAWEVASGREKADFDWQVGKLYALAFSPDGSTVAAGGSKGIVVWDVD